MQRKIICKSRVAWSSKDTLEAIYIILLIILFVLVIKNIIINCQSENVWMPAANPRFSSAYATI